MDRNREGRRGNMAAVSGLSRRRPRTSSLRDSPEEDGGVAEMQESSRLRDRGNKKDRDRDRSGRSKRRRGDHAMHGNNREEGEDSTDESIDEEEEDDDDDAGAPARLSQQPLTSNPSSQPGSLPANHNYRKGLSTKVIRPPAVWKVTDDIVGATVPRKARSASGKRSHECWLSGSGGGGGGGGGSGGGGGEQMNRQASTSPSRSSQAATTPAPISPSSSNVSVKKKTKQICSVKNRPPKISKPSSSIQEIEFEVAEVLYGLTRQFQAPPKQEVLMPDSKDVNGSCGEVKSRASSPNATLPSSAVSECPTLASQGLAAAAAASPSPAVAAPKRKKPRPMKHEDEIPASPPNPPVLPTVLVSSTSKAAEGDLPKIVQAPSPKSEKTAPAPAPEDGVASPVLRSHQLVEAASVQEESKKSDITVASDIKSPVLQSESHERDEMKQEPSASPKENASRLDSNETATAATKTASAAEFPREKFKIDLMAPPPGKSSPERESDFGVDNKPPLPDVEMGPKIEPLRADEESNDRTIKQGTRDGWREERGGGDKGCNEGLNEGKPVKKEASLDLLLEIEKHDRDGGAVGKQTGMRQQPKAPRAESKPDKIAQAGSVPLPVHVPGWPGGLPFGYMGQVPSLQPMVPVDGGSTVAKALQAQQFLSQQLRPKRCATHCYIAHNIYYHQQLARINPFWPAAAGSTSLYGAKPYNLNVVPAADSAAILGDPLQGGFPGRGLSATQDKGAPGGSFPGNNSREKGATANFMDAAQRKQLVLQQPLPAGPANSMMPPPTLIFPLNQTHAAVAAAGGTSRASHVKTTNMNAVASSANDSGAASSGSVAAPTPAVNFSYANLPQGEAQYLVLQNHGYPFPIPAHVGGPPPYRGAANNQAIPFFSGSMYASQMLHPSQLQQQAQAQAQAQALHPPPVQQGTPNASAPTVSSSSQKHSQNPHKAAGGGPDVPAHGLAPLKQRQSLQPHHQQARQPECETGSEDCSSSADGRTSQSQKGGFYANNFVLPPQAFGVSFASFNGAAAAAAAAAAGHHGLDFSSAAQSHTIFQSLPEMARHGYQLSAPAAAAQAAAQHKKAQHLHPESGKFLGDALTVNVPGEEERKGLLAGKASSSITQHSLSFARPETDPSGSAVAGSNVIDRTLNLIPASVAPSRPASAAPAAAGVSSASGDQPNGQHHQQHLIHLQKHHQQQQQLQLQQQQQQQQLASRAKTAGTSNAVGAYSDRMPAGPAMPKFPNALAGFPPAHIHGGGTGQSPQWKNSSRSSSSMPYPAAYTPPVKTHHSQQQQQQQQSRPHTAAAHPTVAAHAQISFGMNSVKSSAAGQQQQQQLAGANSIQPSVSVSSAATSVGSPTSASKGAGGSPKSSNGSKTVPPSALQQQTNLSKSSSVAGASHKSAPASGRNVPSILGQPHVISSPNSVAKSQQLQLPLQQQQNQQQLQLQKQQQPPPQYPAAQIFFTNSYMPTQPPHSGAAASAASAYHQRRSSEQQPQSSAGMLSLCAPALTLTGTATATSDPAKAVAAAAAAAAAANNVKGLPSPGLLQAAQFAAAAAHPASSGTHALMSAAGFSYLHAMSSSMSMKPGEQKPAAGNDTLHACRQPEKR